MNDELETASAPNTGYPLVTYGLIAVCSAIFAVTQLLHEHPGVVRLLDFLAPYEPEIWDGAIWVLFTTALVHGDVLHLLFNMWWLKEFGSVLEPTFGKLKYIELLALTAAISSGVQLAVSSEIGIGFSGVVYGMFGFALAAHKVVPACRAITDRSTTMWLFGWMIFSGVLTQLGLMNVGNAAHVSGFVYGFCLANVLVVKERIGFSKIAGAILTAIALLSVYYMPWSSYWHDRHEITAWWELAESAEAGDAEAQYEYGSSLLWEIDTKAEGVGFLRSAAEQGHKDAMNNLAWLMATDPNAAFRDGKEAVKWGFKACEASQWKDHYLIDTLAAAYAELEQWDDAVKTQEMAISKLTENEKALAKEYGARLLLYQQRNKFREGETTEP